MLRSERLLESLSFIHKSLQWVTSRKVRSKVRRVSKSLWGVWDHELRSEEIQENGANIGSEHDVHWRLTNLQYCAFTTPEANGLFFANWNS
jgi:hypothetical protein